MTASTVMVLVNDDGHVAQLAANHQRRAELSATALLLAELGVPGWTVAETDDLAALTVAMSGYHGCKVCTMCLACGCPVQLAARGMCPHGGGAAIDAAGRRLGLAP